MTSFGDDTDTKYYLVDQLTVLFTTRVTSLDTVYGFVAIMMVVNVCQHRPMKHTDEQVMSWLYLREVTIRSIVILEEWFLFPNFVHQWFCSF